ncbi:hypothetical protein BVER_02721c [Candidatus Burkholderia verschuerenii]|uniref:DUF6895 domain-containing protein n=1 Tax=Candidatus Burkholderia verschuerenii TaxID=242163 RepID=A0A0L0M5R9_9BURK|nr:hypothetical protein BVER_02721c [Candidatus Burkholderia verschuerenii]
MAASPLSASAMRRHDLRGGSVLYFARLAPECNGGLYLDQCDLRRRVTLALEMADQTLTAALKEHPSSPAPPGERLLLLQKVVTESALLLRCCAFLRAVDPDLAARIDRLAAQLAPLARSESVRASLCREPACAIEHAAAHAVLTDFGVADATFDALLTHVLGSNESAAGERLAGQDLEREWLLQVRAGAARSGSPDRGLLCRSVAARPLDALRASSNDLYALTHVLLHATDMGQRGVARPRGQAQMVEDAEAALALSLDADNLDLVAEVLWIWPMAGLTWTPAAVFAFELLAAVQDKNGFLPGPEYSHENEANGELPWSQHVLRTSYHTTYVMAFLCAAMIRARPVALTQGAASRVGNPNVLKQITRLLNRENRTPRWLVAINLLAPVGQVALAPLLLTAALRRAAATSDLVRLRECLVVGLDHGLAEGSAFEQGVRLLERATQFACM